jgi:hypothetical protein
MSVSHPFQMVFPESQTKPSQMKRDKKEIKYSKPSPCSHQNDKTQSLVFLTENSNSIYKEAKE